jgi:hypothetical protein
MMRHWAGGGVGLLCLGWLVWHYAGDHGTPRPALVRIANPGDGRVIRGEYVSEYFGLSFPFDKDWKMGLQGPEPSHSGYYALQSFVPAVGEDAALLIAAQDMFFASEFSGSAGQAATVLRHDAAQSDGMIIEQEPEEIEIAGQHFHRLEFSGVGLFRATYATEIRCHIMTFNFVANSSKRLEEATQSLKNLVLSGETKRSIPKCIRDYPMAGNILEKTESTLADLHENIPVRMIVRADGSVGHVHVIPGGVKQRERIEQQLRQWKFRPLERPERDAGIETGILLRSQ